MFYFDSKFCWLVILWTIGVFESWQLLPIRGGAGRCLAAVCTSRVVGGSGLVGLVGPSGPLSQADTSRSFDRRRKQFTTGREPPGPRLRLGGDRRPDGAGGLRRVHQVSEWQVFAWKARTADALSLGHTTVMTVMQSSLKVATSLRLPFLTILSSVFFIFLTGF